MTDQKSILITGATGFIGLHLAEYLAKRDQVVHVIARSESRLADLLAVGGDIRVHVSDGSTAQMIDILDRAKPICVYHLASLFVGEHTSEDVIPLIDSNVRFGAQLLEAMRVTGAHAVVNAGTSWQHYENSGTRPAVLYAATKEAFEVLARYYADAHGLKVINLKLFDTYGPRDERRKLFWHLRRSAQTGDCLQMSEGEQKIELVYVDDVVRAFAASGDRMEQISAHTVEAFRVPSAGALTLREIVAIYEKTIQTPIAVQWGGRSYRPREIFQPWNGDPVLPGWFPRIGLEEGIRLMEGFPERQVET